MKNLLIILTFFLCACQEKEETDLVNIIPPQQVVYTVKSKSDTRKHIICELWTAGKGQKVAVCDTFITQTDITLTLMQNVQPTFKCVASLTIEVLDGEYDTFAISIGNDKGPIVGREASCETNYYEITDEILYLK